MAGHDAFIELSRAVVRAHGKLFPEESYRDLRTLQNIALALTDLMPIHWRDTGRQLTEPELARLPALDALMVSRLRFEAALDTMQAASLVSVPSRASPPASPRRTIAG